MYDAHTHIHVRICSPLKQLPEFKIPQVLLKKEGGGDETIGAQMFLRTHRRSLSTKESSETNLLSSPQQPRCV